MISWATVVVTLSLVAMTYFLVKGIRMALDGKESLEPPEGDYEIMVIGRLKGGRLLATMSPKTIERPDNVS